MARTVDDLPDLATPKQVREILPLSDYQLRTLIRERRIGHVPIGARFLIPRESIREFIAKNTVSPCPDETKARASASSKNVVASTSCGPSEAAAASAARARQTANKLKSRSPNSYKSGPGETARVIPLKCS